MNRSFDYVVIGAGSAGCVLANRLSAGGKYSVCLVEAGPVDRSALFRIPAAFPYFMFSRKYNWAYKAQSDAAIRNGEPLFVPRGKCLGGSSSTNAMAYVRGQREDFDSWADAGNEGWDYDSLLPYFKRAETFAPGGDDYHGHEGPIFVDQFPLQYPVSKKFLQAARERGHPLNPDFNGASQKGVGVYQYNIKQGRRSGVSSAYLTPASARANLTVLTEATARTLHMEDGVVLGCDLSCRGKRLRLTARREVIVCAGAINSPQLLLRSGIGDAAELGRIGIECVHDLPGVGMNLQEHVDACILVESKRADGLTTSASGLARLLPDIGRYMLRREGRLAKPLIEVGGFIQSSEQVLRPDIQVGLVPVLFDDNGRDLKLMARDGYSCHVCVLRPESRGRVSLSSPDPAAAPVIEFNFFSRRSDREVLVAGVRRVREILNSAAFDSHRGEELHPGAAAQTDDAIFNKCRERLGTVFHPVGTCKMGSDEAAVVDSSLKVRGINRLRIVDASIMPTITSGNTNAPVIAIAERASDLILGAGVQ